MQWALFSNWFSCHCGIYLLTYCSCFFFSDGLCRSRSWLKSVHTACRPFAMPTKRVPAISSLGSGNCKLCRHLSVWTANPPRWNKRTFSEGLCKHAMYARWQTLVSNQETTHIAFFTHQKASLNWACLQLMVPQCHSMPITLLTNKACQWKEAGGRIASCQYKASGPFTKWLC